MSRTHKHLSPSFRKGNRTPSTGSISYPSSIWTRPDAVLYPGGGRREYDDDPLMRITRILAKDPGKNIVLDSSYSYDSMDNILSKQTGQGTYNYTGACPERVEGMLCIA